MKGALLLGPEKIAMGDLAEPYPAAGEVMIKPECAGICGTDVSFYRSPGCALSVCAGS
jgi:threonine dehydrogenase-like Zn-dependent dehydrogenase